MKKRKKGRRGRRDEIDEGERTKGEEVESRRGGRWEGGGREVGGRGGPF
jgi:hypothetical protein